MQVVVIKLCRYLGITATAWAVKKEHGPGQECSLLRPEVLSHVVFASVNQNTWKKPAVPV